MFLTNSGAHINILFIVTLKILVLVKQSFTSFQLCWLLSLHWLSHFAKHAIQSLSNTYVFVFLLLEPHLIPLKYRCSNKRSNWIIVVHSKPIRVSKPPFSMLIRWPYCGHFQLHKQVQSLVGIVDCLIWSYKLQIRKIVISSFGTKFEMQKP
jgi:hypothetical protein